MALSKSAASRRKCLSPVAPTASRLIRSIVLRESQTASFSKARQCLREALHCSSYQLVVTDLRSGSSRQFLGTLGGLAPRFERWSTRHFGCRNRHPRPPGAEI